MTGIHAFLGESEIIYIFLPRKLYFNCFNINQFRIESIFQLLLSVLGADAQGILEYQNPWNLPLHLLRHSSL